MLLHCESLQPPMSQVGQEQQTGPCRWSAYDRNLLKADMNSVRQQVLPRTLPVSSTEEYDHA